MALLSITNASKSFGSNLVLHDVTFQVDARDKVGIIGPNGSGKTTIFRCLLGLEIPETGTIARARDIKISHLQQHNVFDGEKTVLEEVLNGRSDLLAIQAELAEIDTQLETESDPVRLDKIIHRQAALMEDFERGDGYSLQARAEATLAGLGVAERFFERAADSLSGGESGRVALARLLVAKPDVLFLDEPTNHLDLDGVLWLEDYLNRSKATCCIISHDRFFLDRVTTRTIEVDNQGVRAWPGNFSKYEKLKEAANKAQVKEFGEQQDFIRREKEFINKHIGSQRTKEAKGRQKRLERLERIQLPHDPSRDMTLTMKLARAPGVDMIEVEDLSVGHDGEPLLSGLNIRIERQDRVGIIGPNGSGKTTLLNVLLDRLPPLAGSVHLGSTVDIGYFDQRQAHLDPESTPFETISAVDLKRNDEEIRSWLARFLFYDDSIDRKISSLSGGERSRLMLARLILCGPNVLVLDEPTNHLDIPSRTALESALADYPGTILTVSHDRFFLDRIATRIIALGNKTPDVFVGNYSIAMDRLDAKAREAADIAEPRTPKKNKKSRGKPDSQPASRKRSSDAVEQDIMFAETEREALLAEMESPAVYSDPVKVSECKEKLVNMDRRLRELEEEWDDLM